MSEPSAFPPGWDEDRVRRVVAHYEKQTELVPAVHELIAKRKR